MNFRDVAEISEALATSSVEPATLNREDLRDAEVLLQLCSDERFVLSAAVPTEP